MAVTSRKEVSAVAFAPYWTFNGHVKTAPISIHNNAGEDLHLTWFSPVDSATFPHERASTYSATALFAEGLHRHRWSFASPSFVCIGVY